VLAFRRQGLTLPASPQDTLVFDGGGPDGAARGADGADAGSDGGRHAAEPAAGTGEAGR
jgi:hypothetical protein